VSVRISVLIPNLHCPRIGETVAAVLAQEGELQTFEVIVVGRDRYGVIPEDPRVRFIETERDFTPSEARNRAIAESTGALLLFLDADCVPEPDWMARMLARHAEGHPIVAGALTFDRGDFWTLADNISAHHGALPSNPAGPMTRFHPAVANLCLERRLLDEVGTFDESLVCAEDFDLMMRLKAKGYGFFFEPAARAAHRHGRGNFGAFVRHAAAWAPDSVAVRNRYADLIGSPGFLRFPWALRLLSPAIALGVTGRIWLRHPELWRDVAALPAVFLAKLVWCWAAARGPRRREAA
jgi:GT2 family glycosyltransferase